MLEFTTRNCDGKYVSWSFTIEELRKEYWSDGDIPMCDDPVVDCEFKGIPLYFYTFLDLVHTFGIDMSEP